MGDFTVDSFKWLPHEYEQCDYYERLLDDFGWYCLGHNFDVVGAILSMADLSWQKGFDAGRIIANFNDETLAQFDPNAYAEYFKSVQ